MQNAPEKNPSHSSAVLLRQTRQWHEQFHKHRLENLRKQAKELLEQFHRNEAPAIERFGAHHPNFPKGDICLADAQAVIAREQGFASWPKMKSSLEQVTLSDEVERLHRKLRADGKEQFVPVITEESLRRAILKGMESHEAHLHDSEHEGSGEYWHDYIKPILLKVVETGIWTDKGSIDVFYETKNDLGVAFEGLGACLEMRTPGARYPGYCLSILDLWYGRLS